MDKKRVLFIGIGFYDYEKAITGQFKQLGYEVDYFSEVPANGLKYRLYSRFNNTGELEKIRAKHSIQIANNCSTDYDVVFIIKCEYLTVQALEIIKLKNPKANYVLYLWDSITRLTNIEAKFPFFNKVYSFDRLDCLSNELLNFNPLFFREEYITDQIDIERETFGLYHLGWYHSDRLHLIVKIARYLDENSIKYNLVLFTGYFSYLMQRLFGGELGKNRKYLIFKTLSAASNFANILKSKSTLDIAHPLQSGLTMRTIELLGVQRKIITTNSDIVNYDFYHPNNVLVIDRENPVLNIEFFDSEFIPVSNEIVSKYSIHNWLKRMLN
ncbi:hypothetical protein [Pedobacter sp. FW305-3-2-15-E-R2A2]|uniref:hypothetical protein n=1 Tax=Pedobacter sp. FW305-3-2-15-E-R2A2 TaxID=3140251 RepID=UPI0031406DBC